METISSSLDNDFVKIMSWADEFSSLTVLANADTPNDAHKAMEFGAKGIGLCRTEHMFFEGQRIRDIREMIMAKNSAGRKHALDNLYPYQKEDFKGIFRAMENFPVNVRLLDPPLHEFLPKAKEEIEEMAEQLQLSAEEVVKVIEDLAEVNPMMGLRGCRLGLMYPEIYAMQVKAIIDEGEFVPQPEIMIPLVGNELELSTLHKLAEQIFQELDPDRRLGQVKIGTMIEVPRACLVADQIAAHADYFSFGTNDLTQMTLGFSRDDSGSFIRKYKEQKILNADPFQSIDQEGVGELMKIAIAKGKAQAPNLKIGVCGEHGGDPASVSFFNTLGIHYVSCSPYRIPKARLAAGQAAIQQLSHQEDATRVSLTH